MIHRSTLHVPTSTLTFHIQNSRGPYSTKPNSNQYTRLPVSSANMSKPSPQQALVYYSDGDDLLEEDITEANSTCPSLPNTRQRLSLFSLGKSNAYEISLPRWRNRVDIYTDMEAKTGFLATLRLDRLGAVKNLQRRLGRNYQVLYVRSGSGPAA